MNTRILIAITDDRATPALYKLISAMQPARVGKVTGPKLRETVRDHIKRLPRNKKGWPSTGFWEDAARGVTWTSDDTGVTVTINKIGFGQRFYGGTISAVKAKYLTIPIASQAYGKTVADFPGSFIINTPKGAYVVQYGGSVSKNGRGVSKHSATLEFLFILKRSVNQAENRSIIPDDTILAAVAIASLQEHFRRVKAGGA